MWKTWSSGIDWVTAVAKLEDLGALYLTETGIELLRERQAEGHKMEPVSFLNYTGFASDGIRLMSRYDSILLQLSGACAHEYALKLRESNERFRITRLDFEVTAQADSPKPNHERDLLREWSNRHHKKDMANTPNHGFTCRGSRGSTFMVGSRNSPQHAVFYNKTAEQRHKIDPNLHRAEVRYRGDLAGQMWDSLGMVKSPMSFVHECVRAFCTSRGIPCEWIGGECKMRMPTSYTPTTDEKSLEWLSSHVSKTALRLSQSQGPESVLRALKLTDKHGNLRKPQPIASNRELV